MLAAVPVDREQRSVPDHTFAGSYPESSEQKIKRKVVVTSVEVEARSAQEHARS